MRNVARFLAFLAVPIALAVATAAPAQDSSAPAAAETPSPPRPTFGGQVTGGTQGWWQDEPDFRYREYKDLPRGLFLDSFELWSWGSKWQMSAVGENFLRGDQRTVLRLDQGTHLGLSVNYLQIPHLLSQIAITPYTQVGVGTFLLPDSVQARIQRAPVDTAGVLNDLIASSGTNPELHTRTNVGGGRLYVRPSNSWLVDATVETRNRDGVRARTASLGFSNVVEVGAPESDRTVDARVSGHYNHGRLRGQASAGHIWYDNHVDEMVWDNYLRITDVANNPKQGRLEVAPSNRVLYGQLGFSYDVTPKTLLSANFGLKRGTQDDLWQPFTINSAIPQSNPDSLPGTSTNAKYVQDTEDVRLTSRALDHATTTLRFHHMKYDNQTEEVTFIGRSAYDASWTPGPFTTTAPGFDRTIWGLDVDYSLGVRTSVGVLGEWRVRNFVEREVEKTEEAVAGASVRLNPLDPVTLDAHYRHGNRTAGTFDFDTQRFATPFDIADRRQDVIGAGATWAMTEKLDLILAYDDRQNDYPESPWGLQEENEEIGSATFSYQAQDNLELTLGAGLGRIKIFMHDNHLPNPVGNVAQPLSPDSTWDLNIADKNTWGFARADWWAMTRKLRITGEYDYRRGYGTYDFTTPLGNAVDPPQTDYWQHEIEVQAMVRVRYDFDLGVRYDFARAITQDWQQGDIPILDLNPTRPSQVRGVLTGTALLPEWNAHRVALMATKRF